MFRTLSQIREMDDLIKAFGSKLENVVSEMTYTVFYCKSEYLGKIQVDQKKELKNETLLKVCCICWQHELFCLHMHIYRFLLLKPSTKQKISFYLISVKMVTLTGITVLSK